ncbi:MAG TPA: hypothetical protein VEC11_12985 [Allosphingosinicella sp.]|nr:hypothetical protein [Allosphingosinicella sp.]
MKRTGNVRTSAFEAGVDPGTAYDHRAKDAGFRAGWAGALKGFAAMEAKKRARGPLHHGSHGPPPRAGEELILRRTKHGDKLVRAVAGRWSRRVEESFLDGLEATGCVRSAAAAAGLSTNAFYNRREKYPEFAARWDERVGRFREQLPGLINAAAVESMSPGVPGAKRRGRARLPKLSGGEAVRVYAINENAKAKARGPARRGGISARELQPERSEEEEKEEVVQKLATLLGMLKRRRAQARLAAGWTQVNGIWLPPGWTATGPDEGSGGGTAGPGHGAGR